MRKREPDLTTPGGRLTFARKARGFLTQAAFCRDHDLPYSAYGHHERNRWKHAVYNLTGKYAKLLKVPHEWLLKGGEIPADLLTEPLDKRQSKGVKPPVPPTAEGGDAVERRDIILVLNAIKDRLGAVVQETKALADQAKRANDLNAEILRELRSGRPYIPESENPRRLPRKA